MSKLTDEIEACQGKMLSTSLFYNVMGLQSIDRLSMEEVWRSLY
jgi:hypothetical protein